MSSPNVLGHIFCTTLGFVGGLRLFQRLTNSTLAFLFVLSYLALLYTFAPFQVSVVSSIWLTSLFVMIENSKSKTRYSSSSLLIDVCLIAAGYFGQDLCHFLSKEATFQSTYSGSDVKWTDFSAQFMQHTFYLLPLVTESSLEHLKHASGFSVGVSAFAVLLFLTTLDALLGSNYLSFMFPWTVPRNRVLRIRVKKLSDLRKLDQIGQWWWNSIGKSAYKRGDHTTWHAWLREKNIGKQPFLPSAVANSFDEIVNDVVLPAIRNEMPGLCVGRVDAMDEVYVSRPSARSMKSSSDDVFIVPHIDGPFYSVPFSSVYRVLVTVRGDPTVSTHFPVNRYPKEKIALQRGDICGFDFNREVHFITKNDDKNNESTVKPVDSVVHLKRRKSPRLLALQRKNIENENGSNIESTYGNSRILLKVHVLLYPWYAAPFGFINWVGNAMYDFVARTLFLSTIGGKDKDEKTSSSSSHSKFGANIIVAMTIVYAWIEAHIGFVNLSYLAFCFLLSCRSGKENSNVENFSFWNDGKQSLSTLKNFDFHCFLGLISFAHYFLYMGVYYNAHEDSNVAYGRFVRNARFLKCVAMSSLVGAYLPYFFSDILFSVRNLFVLIGAGIGLLAALRLGQEGTYFGIELGIIQMKKNYVAKFPYGTLPHPMVLGQIICFLALHSNESFRAMYPYLVPIHVALYVVHTIQEQFDVRVRTN